MVASRIAFQAIEISGFRGFHDRRKLDLDASAIILVGSNGTGKTSFFDAIQWLLTGGIPRLADEARSRKAEFVLNQWSNSGTAEVTADLLVDNQPAQIRRMGSSSRSVFEMTIRDSPVPEDEANHILSSVLLPSPRAELREALDTTSLLQQDVLRAVIEGTPSDRFNRLAKMLGLEAITVFEKASRVHADEASRKAKALEDEVEHLLQQLVRISTEEKELSQRIRNAPVVAEVDRNLRHLLDELSVVISPAFELHLAGDELTRVSTEARLVRERIDAALTMEQTIGPREHAQDVSVEQLVDSTDKVERAENDLRAVNEQLNQVRMRLTDLESANRMFAGLAADALPLLTDVCPVCEQSIDRDSLARRLTTIIETANPDLLLVRAELAESVAAAERLEVELVEATKERDGLAAALRMAEQTQLKEKRWTESCSAIFDGIELLGPTADQSELASRSSLLAVRDAVTKIEWAFRDAVAAISVDSLVSVAESRRAEIVTLEEALDRLQAEANAARQQAASARTTQHKIVAATSHVADRRVRRLIPLLTEIYSRLDPHPAFTDLDYDLRHLRQRTAADPVAVDPMHQLRVDPLLVFSSAQINVVALSFFLANSWADSTLALPFLLLDDPLQAMDDINALGFSDLCRHLRTQRQLMVSTHDRRIGNLLERKLAPRTDEDRTFVLRFEGWDRYGPQIKQELVEPQVEEGRRRDLVSVA